MWWSPGWALTGRTEDGSRAGGTARVSCASWASSPARCLLRILVTLMLKSSFPKSLLYWSLRREELQTESRAPPQVHPRSIRPYPSCLLGKESSFSSQTQPYRLTFSLRSRPSDLAQVANSLNQ